MYKAFDPRYRLMVLVGCYAGLRIGEQAGLRVADILFGHGEIFVRHGAFEPLTGPVQIGPLKTPFLQGEGDVPQFLLDELRRYITDHPPSAEGSSAGLIFTSPEGEPLRPRNWRRRYWDPAVEAAGIEAATSHAMRHTFVSFLIDQGLSVEKVAEQARHRDPGFTWRVYRHRFERRAEEGPSDAALALENVWVRGLSPRDPGGRRGDRRRLQAVQSQPSTGPSGP